MVFFDPPGQVSEQLAPPEHESEQPVTTHTTSQLVALPSQDTESDDPLQVMSHVAPAVHETLPELPTSSVQLASLHAMLALVAAVRLHDVPGAHCTEHELRHVPAHEPLVHCIEQLSLELLQLAVLPLYEQPEPGHGPADGPHATSAPSTPRQQKGMIERRFMMEPYDAQTPLQLRTATRCEYAEAVSRVTMPDSVIPSSSMTKVLGALAVPAVLLAACSSSPTGDCDNAASTLCNKQFQCNQTTAINTWGTESGCEAKTQANWSCATWACPAGKTYDGSQVEACINAYNNLSCANANTVPAECQGLQPACK